MNQSCNETRCRGTLSWCRNPKSWFVLFTSAYYIQCHICERYHPQNANIKKKEPNTWDTTPTSIMAEHYDKRAKTGPPLSSLPSPARVTDIKLRRRSWMRGTVQNPPFPLSLSSPLNRQFQDQRPAIDHQVGQQGADSLLISGRINRKLIVNRPI